jgi:hypothetical protein
MAVVRRTISAGSVEARPQVLSASGSDATSALACELLGELGFGERRRLDLELHFLDARARGLERLLARQARFLVGTKLRPHSLDEVARGGERLLGLSARCELALQRLLDRRPVDRFALAGQAPVQRVLLGDLRDEAFATTLEVGDAIARAAFGKRGFRLARSACRTRSRPARARRRPRCAVRAASRA